MNYVVDYPKVSVMDLFVTSRCRRCGKMTIHGFWDQLLRWLDPDRMKVRVYLICKHCGRRDTQNYKVKADKTL